MELRVKVGGIAGREFAGQWRERLNRWCLGCFGFDTSYTAALSTSTIGTQVETFSMNVGDDQTLPGASVPVNLSTSATLTVLDHAAGIVTVTSGNGFLVHAGSNLLLATINLSNAAGTRSDLEVGSAPSITSGTLGNGPATPYYVPAGTAQAYTAAFNAPATPGKFTDTVTFASAGENQSLPGADPLSSLSVSITGNVYSGQAVWNATSGSWGTNAYWKDMIGGGPTEAPGLAGYATDTATFGPTVFSGIEFISLDAATPVLSSLVFNSSTVKYWVFQGVGTSALTLTGSDSSSPAALTVIRGAPGWMRPSCWAAIWSLAIAATWR